MQSWPLVVTECSLLDYGTNCTKKCSVNTSSELVFSSHCIASDYRSHSLTLCSFNLKKNNKDLKSISFLLAVSTLIPVHQNH